MAKRYMIIVKLDIGDGPARITRDVPPILSMITGFSGGEQEMVFRSDDGLLFGFLAKTDRGEFLKPEFEKLTATTGKDSILVFEAGPLTGGLGFMRAWTWLQHH